LVCQIFFVGGETQCGTEAPSGVVDIWTESSNSWSVAYLSRKRTSFAAVRLAATSIVVVGGGTGAITPLNNLNHVEFIMTGLLSVCLLFFSVAPASWFISPK
jgi:hypothetical protein